MKSSLYDVMTAIDSLPEQDTAFGTDEERIAYVVACEKVAADHGWDVDEFIIAMTEALGSPSEVEE